MNYSSKRALRVLRLASFAGNIGDLANHEGVKNLFNKYLNYKFEFYDLEIREYYWKKRYFDSSFIELINSYDLVMIGGGNYFEVWVENSATGTSIDIDLKLFKEIKVPMIFYSLGIDIGQGYTVKTADKFRRFIKILSSKEDVFLSIRNDGSFMAAEELLGIDLASNFTVIPDGGFFILSDQDKTNIARYQSNHSQKIGINLAGDMLQNRLGDDAAQKIYIQQMAFFVEKMLEQYQDIEFELIPHIWRDLLLYGQLLPLIKDEFLRRRISIASLKPFGAGLKEFISNYASCNLVLGTRFHANVCPIGLGIPTRGLYNYPQIKKLYFELSLESRVNDVRGEYYQSLVDAVSSDMSDLISIRSMYTNINKKLAIDAENSIAKINSWLNKIFP
jgi:polysaccharide pyruvyl transferase WcaK-like protein